MGIQTLLDEVKSRLDIVQVVSQYVDLKKRGKNFVALCPFHVERTPSFTVSPDKQIFYCFGCGKGGDVIKFLMLMEDLSFKEALKKAAEAAGIEFSFEEEKKGNGIRLREIHGILCGWFCKFLKTDVGEKARKYLISRGISPVWWERFKIGFSPSGFDLATPLIKKGYTKEELLESGIFSQKNGDLYCKFVNRIIIPIFDGAGRVIAFGGRVIGEGEPKYLNSPETPIFSKGKIVYAYHLAKETVKNKDRVIVAEGYMDVISLHIHGYTESVAALGTSLTEEQAKKISRLSKNIYLLFDSDEAGFRAAVRASKIFYKLGIEPLIVRLPEGEDPDSYLRKEKDLEDLIKAAKNPVDTIIDDAKLKNEFSGALSKSKLLERLLELVEDVTDKVILDSFFSYVSDRLDISKNILYSKFEGFKVKRGSRNSHVMPKVCLWERDFLKLILRDKTLFCELKSKLLPEIFTDSLVSSILSKLLESEGIEGALNKFDEEEMKFVGSALFSKEELDVEALLKRFERRHLEYEVQRLKEAFLREENKDLCLDLQRRYFEKLKFLKGGRA